MIIGVDGNEANVKEKVGVSFYTLKLLEHFKKKANKNLMFITYLRDKPSDDLPREDANFIYEVVNGKFLWSQLYLPLALYKNRLSKHKIDVFFSPAHYSPRFCPVPFIVTIHDLSYFYYPEEFLKKDLYQLTNWTKKSVDKSKRIIAVSKTTKKDIVKFYQIPEAKIEVVYNGYEKKVKNQKSRPKAQAKGLSAFGGDRPMDEKIEKNKYILYVGTIQPRKNLLTLIRAFEMYNKQFPEFKLVIAGKKGWLYDDIFEEVKQRKLNNKIIFTGYLPSEKINWLYENAFCFVLPSLYEGFGIPLLEAMSFNCPVISSFTSSLPEVGDEACLYFDPKNEVNLYEKLVSLKENENLRQELIEKGKKRVKLFSWSKCAQETLEVIIDYDKNN
jgi:glycosyltransferase involved in cell wall biosynthesis